MSPTAMAHHASLPSTIEPILLAEKGVRLVGALSLRSMPRLREMCSGDQAEISIDLQFGPAEAGEVYEMHGQIRATLPVTCQRCLEPMPLAVVTDTRLLLLRAGEQAEGFSPDVETLVVDRPLVLSELVEDELLLVMPMTPLHPLAQCGARQYLASQDPTGKPLSGLGRLKRS